MTDAGELFARLTGELEDMHGLGIEGQAAGQPPEALIALADSIAKGLKRAARTLLMIRLSINSDA